MANRRTRIVGQMLGQFLGKDVVVLGRLTKIGCGGNTVELTTFDSTRINVSLPTAIEAEPNDLLEVWGNVKSKGTMVAGRHVFFDDEHIKDFDQKAYDDLIIMQHTINDRKWKLNSDRSSLN